MLVTALIAMVFATTAQHLGLLEAAAEVVSKIASCPKCSSFWISLGVLIYMGCEPFIAMGLSLLVAYLSYWFGLIVIYLNILYNKIWERLTSKK